MNLPFSPAADRNKEPILNVLKEYISIKGRLLEIGSGTGQHAVYFAQNLPQIEWMTTDKLENHPVIKQYIEQSQLKNLKGPKKLVVGIDDFPSHKPYDYVFSANTLHIMSWKEDKTLFKLLGKRLIEGSLVFFYGPFNYNNEYTSQSNQDFDQSLKTRDPKSGIRNFEDVVKVMEKSEFKLLKDHEMPANNRLLVFQKKLSI